MENAENLPPDDDDSFLAELQQFEKALSMSEHSSSPSRENGGSVSNGAAEVAPSETSKQRKIVYKVTLQPRLSESAQGPEVPAQYLELFEKLQPRIIARGIATDSESLLTLNHSLRPKKASKSSVTEREAPLRIIGGRRMPPEALADERRLSPWSIRNRGSLTLPITRNNGCFSPEIPRSRTLPSQGVGIRGSEGRASVGGLNGGRDVSHPGTTERPRSTSWTSTDRALHSRSFCARDVKDSSSWAAPHEFFSPLADSSSYRNYSQQIFRNARKLNSFSSNEEEQKKPEFFQSMNGNQLGHYRSISVDFSGLNGCDPDMWLTPPAPVFNSPPISCETISSADEDEFLRNSLLPRRMQRFGSVQGLENTDPSSEIPRNPYFLSNDHPAPTETAHPTNAPPLDAFASPGPFAETEVSRGCHFDPTVVTRPSCGDTGTSNGNELETNPDSDTFIPSSGVDLLFQMMAQRSGHLEREMTPDTSTVEQKNNSTPLAEQGRDTLNANNEGGVDLSSSMSCSAETDWSELTDDSSTPGEPKRTAEDQDAGCQKEHEHDSGRSDDSSWNDDGEGQLEVEKLEEHLPEESPRFVSKVTVLLRRPREAQDQPPTATSPLTGCRIQQIPIRQLKPIQERTGTLYSHHR